MSEKKLRRLPLAAAALVACVSAQAEYQSPDGNFRMSGFGTLGAAKSTTDEAYFNYPGQGGGADQNFNLNPDSKVAVQGTYKITNTVSGTAQILAKYNADGAYVPGFEWAFAKWQATPGLALRAGRMGAPFFMISDFRDVGYANTPVRPVLDVYGQVPVSAFDGADLAYQASFGPVTLTSTLWGGSSKASYASALKSQGAKAAPSEVVIREQMGLNLQAEFDGGYALRLGHSQGKLSVNSASANTVIGLMAPVLAGAVGPTAQAQAQSLRSALTTNNANATFTGIGLSVDRDNFVLGAEFTKRKIKQSYVPDTTGWYTLVGYRIGSVLPYVSFSKLKVDDPNTTMPTVTSGFLTSAAAATQAILNTQKITQRTTSVGARWDVSSGLALKAQYDRVAKPSGSNGLFLVTDPITALSTGGAFLNAKKDISVMTLSVDFVF